MPATQDLAYSIQTVYNLYWDEDVARKTMSMKKALRCRETIKIPVLETVSRPYKQFSSDGTIIPNFVFDVIPVTAIVIENDFTKDSLKYLRFIIETNEGVTVEPIVIEEPLTAYLLVLPRGTNSVKNVRITVADDTEVPNDLTFDVMDAPYNYENYLFALLSDQTTKLGHDISYLRKDISILEGRIRALENKEGA